MPRRDSERTPARNTDTTVPGVPSTSTPTATFDYTTIVKTLLPFLSPEDAQALETAYSLPHTDRQAATEITGSLRNYYLGKQRATDALTALENARSAAGNPDMGTGYNYLKNAIGLVNTYGASAEDQGMSRSAYNEYYSKLNALYGTSDTTVAPYESLAKLFTSPTLAAGPLTPQTTLQSGAKVYGQANKKLYT